MSSDFNYFLSQLPHRQRKFARGTLIFARDDAVLQYYRVEAGEVHLLRHNQNGDEFILQRAVPGQILAEASLTSAQYHCSAQAVAVSVLAIWPRRAVRQLIAGDVRVAERFAEHLAREVRNARLRAEIISLRKVADRLDAWLAWHDDGLPAKGNWRRVAGEIGVSPEALYRELSRRNDGTE